MKLKNKVAIVTGASRGIGRSIARELAKNGANVAFTYHNSQSQAEEAVKEIESFGSRGMAIKANVSVFAKAKEVIKTVIDEFGQLDILINNAGINIDKPLFMMPEEDWDQVMDTNLKGTFNYARAAIVPFLKQESGCIVNISSIGGIMASPGQTNYCSSKSGINTFTKALAKEVASRNVRVNAIAPGFIETDMSKSIRKKRREELFNLIPMKRLGRAEEISNVVLFLVSDAASYLTGQTIIVDGGLAN